ncbi:MAG TPA: hypothetical protein VG077_07970 [Verrucomicrobiae bacterium]|nr:hypothetical protein [Verrucomicrobiae bacterium]
MMDTRRIPFALLAAAFLLTGCRESNSAESAPPDQPPATPAALPTTARVHWLGIKRLSGDTNAASLMTIWNLPESRKLEQQTLDKLSLAPWPVLHRNPDTNAAAFLRPLLDDLVANESYWEIRQTTNQLGELALAIRLDDRRAALWQTNLARVLESLTGIPPAPAPDHRYGWSLKKHHDPNFLELARARGWTILGAAEDHNELVAELKSRIQRGQVPLPTGNTNDWLAADFDPARLAAVLSLSARRGEIPSLAGAGVGGSTPRRDEAERRRLNRFYLAVTGDGTNVLCQGTVGFSRPLALELQPWNIPTNLMDQQLSSFTLIRGFKAWLESAPAWTRLQIGPPPDQACFWALWGLPMQNYFTAPLPGASNEVGQFTDWALQNQGRWLATNDQARFERSTTFNGLEWKGLPLLSPFLRSITVGNQSFLYGGGFPNAVGQPLSLKSVQNDLSRTNLVYHDWELTGLRTRQWLDAGQIVRFLLHKATLPSNSTGYIWLKAIPPGLGASVTDITQTGPNQLYFNRQSTLGFTGIELNLLADWLESPQFPRGLYSLLTPPPPQSQ